jgi:hypothetical protein
MVAGFSKGTQSFGSALDSGTTTLLDQGEKQKNGQRPAPRRTDNVVDESEKGDDKVKDALLAGESSGSPDATRLATAERQRMAQNLVELVRRLRKCKVKSQRAAHLAVLKRELAAGHAALAPLPSERNYTAIITLVEGAIAATRWEDLSDYDLGLLKDALGTGLTDGPSAPMSTCGTRARCTGRASELDRRSS